jgi:hypothetical protein
MSKVKGSIIESQSSSASEKQGLDLQKLQFLKRFWAKEGWRSGIRATRAL